MTLPTGASRPTFEAHVDLGHLPSTPATTPVPPKGRMPGAGAAAVVLLWTQMGMWSCAVLLFGVGALVFTVSAAAETGTPLLEAFTGDSAFTVRLVASSLAMLLVLVLSAVFAVRIARGRNGARQGAIALEAAILPVAVVHLLMTPRPTRLHLLNFAPGELLVLGVCVTTMILLNRSEVRAWCHR